MSTTLDESAARYRSQEAQREERRKKRVITAKRKEQNREAQKRYRESEAEEFPLYEPDLLIGEKKKAGPSWKASSDLTEYPRISNVEELLMTPYGFDSTDFSTSASLDNLRIGDDGSLETLIYGSSSSSDPFSGSDFNSLLYEQQPSLNSSLNWQYPAPTIIQTMSPPPVEALELLEISYSPSEERSSSSTSHLPSPYRNHIRLNRLCLYAACYENVLQMGISIEIAETPRCPSPFYQSPPISKEQNPVSFQISSTCGANLKPDLQPSTIQRTHPHEIYLDVYPFPKWRDKVIQLLSISPPAFDEMELKRDLDRDGLICWGSMGGKGSGTPWDSRSWEAQKWFLEKWWFLAKDSGVDTQSEWWRMMRGEDEKDESML